MLLSTHYHEETNNMAEKQIFTSGKSYYPLTLSVAMIVVALVLSFVDLAFLNDVIGKILDLDATQSMLIAFALGLVGIAVMAHQGVKEAHGSERFINAFWHYLLWVGLGLAFVLIRLFSASILQLDGTDADEHILKVLGLNIREVDLVLAPVMLFLYFATGLLAKDGFKNLFLNPEFMVWSKERKSEKLLKKVEMKRLADKAAAKQAKLEAQAEADRDDFISNRNANKGKALADNKYHSALGMYRAKEKDIKQKYQIISTNIDYVKSIDKQEYDFETRVKPSLMRIINESIHSVQNNVALMLRKKTGDDINKLRSVIDTHNSSYDELKQ